MNTRAFLCAAIGLGVTASCSGTSGQENSDERVQTTSSALTTTNGLYQHVTGLSPSDPLWNGTQSETALGISPLGNGRAIAVVTYNNKLNDSFNVYNATTHQASVGSSFMGWSWVNYDMTKPASAIGAWTYGGTVQPPTSLGFSMLWGDPALTVSQKNPNYVFISNLAVPTSKLNGATSITGSKTMSLEPFLGGACIARSSDNGQHFAIAQCLQNLTNTGGDFYDGGSMATSTDGSVFAAYRDVDRNAIDVWKAPSETGTFVQLGDPFPGLSITSHPRMVGSGLLYIAALELNMTLNQVNLWMNVMTAGGWQTPTLIASNVQVLPIITVPPAASPTNGTQLFRTAGTFSFDVGRPSRNNNDYIRVAVTVQDSGNLNHIQTYGCVTKSGTFSCIRTPEWDSTSSHYESNDFEQWEPLVRATVSSGPAGNPTWALTYKRRLAPSVGAAFGSFGYFMNVESNGTRDIAQAGGDEFPWTLGDECPDEPTDGASNPGYLGDYDSLAVASESWIPDGNGIVHPYFLAMESIDQPYLCTQQLYASSSEWHVATNWFWP